MALIIDNNNGFQAPAMYCMPVNHSDAVVSDDNNSRSDSPVLNEQEFVLQQPKKDDVSEQERNMRRISRIPCKARGIIDASRPHTARNAYIDIPDNAVHGMNLICSHEMCAKTRRFRYCTVCGIPVAKRNFLKRHGHGLLKARQRILVPEESPMEHDRPGKKPRIGPSPDPHPPPVAFVDPASPGGSSTGNGATGGPFMMTVTSEERQLLELFRSRPQFATPQTMDSWVQKIVSIANVQTQPPPLPPPPLPMRVYSSPLSNEAEMDDDNSVDEFIGKWFEEV